MPLNTLENALKKHGGIISEIEEFYLLGSNKICQINTEFDVEILEGTEIKSYMRTIVRIIGKVIKFV